MATPTTQKFSKEDKDTSTPIDRFSDAPPQWKKLEEILAMRSSAGESVPPAFTQRPPNIVTSAPFNSVSARQSVPVKGDSGGVYTPKPFQHPLPVSQNQESSCEMRVVGSGISQPSGVAHFSHTSLGQNTSHRPPVPLHTPPQTYSFASPPHLVQSGYVRASAVPMRVPRPHAPPPQLLHPFLPPQQPPPALNRNARSSSTHIIESISQLVNQAEGSRAGEQHRQPLLGASANFRGNGFGGAEIGGGGNGVNSGAGMVKYKAANPQTWSSGRSNDFPPPPPPPSTASGSVYERASSDKQPNLTQTDENDLRRLKDLMEISRAETEICQMEMVMQNQETEATEQRRLARERAFQQSERSRITNDALEDHNTRGNMEPELLNDTKPEQLDTLDRIRRENKYWSTGLVSGGPSDRELISLLLARLTQLESQLARSKEAIAERDQIIEELKKNVSDTGKTVLAPVGRGKSEKKYPSTDGGKDELQRECRRLQKYVREMEKFLADYGLEWVGVGSGASSDDLTTARSHADAEGDGDKPDTLISPGTSPRGGDAGAFSVNFDLLTSRVAELNVLAGADQPQLCRTPRGARFMMIPPLPLAVYGNGVLLENGPFRPYSDPLVQLLIMDLQDGYFPTELKERFPDGVPLKLMDRRHEQYHPPTPPRTFSGPGYRLGGRRRTSRLIPEHYSRMQKEREQQQQLEEQRRMRGGSIEPTGRAGSGLYSARGGAPKQASARRTPSSSGYLSAASSAGSRGSSAGCDHERAGSDHDGEACARQDGNQGCPNGRACDRNSGRSRKKHADAAVGCDRGTSPLPPRCRLGQRPPSTQPLSAPPPPKLGLQQQSHQLPPPRQSVSTVELCTRETGEENRKTAPPGGATSLIPLTSTGTQSQAVSRFLARLPKTVVRNGRLIEIRRSVEELLTGRLSPSTDLPPMGASTPPPAEPAPSSSKPAQTEPPIPPPPQPPSPPPQPTTVRVRTPQDSCLTLQLRADSTIAELRKSIDANIGARNSEPYGLMTAYPRRMLWNTQLTLRECGLTPNGVVVMTRQRSM